MEIVDRESFRFNLSLLIRAVRQCHTTYNHNDQIQVSPNNGVMLLLLQFRLTGNEHEQMFSHEPLDKCCVTTGTQTKGLVTSLDYSGLLWFTLDYSGLVVVVV